LKVPVPAYGILWLESSGRRRVSHITADLNVPAILVGTHFKQGTSVFAYGCAALELVRIDFAQAGVPKGVLDTLTTEQVSLLAVRVPYLFQSTAATDVVASPAPARKSRRKKAVPESASFPLTPSGGAKPALDRINLPIPQRAMLLGLDCKLGPNDRGLEYRARADNSPPGKHGVVVILERQSLAQVRVDVLLEQAYLQMHGWDALDSWRNAYADDRYT